ncbi:MAG: M28 family peptidase [Opitutaceae bacterium]
MTAPVNPFVLPCVALVLSGLLPGCSSRLSPNVAAHVGEVSAQRLRGHVEALTRIGSAIEIRREASGRRIAPRNADSQAEKIAYLRSQLEPLGYTIEVEAFDLPPRFTPSRGYQGKNLIATKRGTTQPEHVLELGAHHDTFGTPGADDNSSGVAGVLEVARVLAAVPTAKTIRFCLFDFEEFGGLGSIEHVKRVKASAEKFEGILVFEMIGYAVSGENTQETPLRIPGLVNPSRTGNFIAVLGDLRSGNLGAAFERAADRLNPRLPYFSLNRLGGFLKDAARSDQSSYWEASLPGVMITDTANFRNPHYHKSTDTIGTLNFEFMAQVVSAMTGCLLDRAGAADAAEVRKPGTG